MAAFDAEAARSAGWAEADIARFQARIDQARSAGYNDAEIAQFLASASPGASPGTAPTEVRAAPAQISGLVRIPALVGSAALKGAATTLGLPGLAEQAAVNYLVNPIQTSLGYEPDTGQFFPTPGMIHEGLGRLGLVDRADLQAEGPAERILSAGAEGAGASLPFSLGAVGRPALNALTGVVGAEAGEGARALGAPPEAQVAVGVLAGLGTQGAASLLAQTPASIAKRLGTSETLEQAGVALQDAARDWRGSTFTQRIEDAARPLDAAIPAGTTTPPSEMASRIEQLLARGGQAASSTRDFLNRTSRSGGQLGEATDKVVSQLGPSTGVADWFKGDLRPWHAAGPPRTGSYLTWEEARRLRTELGTLLRTEHRSNREATEFLYGGLSEDLRQTAQRTGNADLFDNFNRVSTAVHQFDSGPIEGILGARQPADAASRLLSQARRGGSGLAELRSELPDAVDELAAAHLRLSPDGRAWQKLAPEAREALLPEPAHREVVSSASSPVGPSRMEMVERGIRTGLGGSYGGYALHYLLPGVDPATAAGIGGLAGTLAPYVWRGSLAATKNPLYGTIGGTAAGGNSLAPAP